MPSHEAVSDKTVPPSPGPKIDLTKYRTTDFVEGLTELVSVPGALLKIVKTSLLLALVFVVGYGLLVQHYGLSGVVWFLVGGLSLVMGLVSGFLLGVALVLHTTMLNIESILRTVLDISSQAAGDYERIQTGKMQLPSGTQLVKQVYDEVFLPAMEEAVASAFGFLKAPLLWIYRRTIGSAVRYLLKRMKREPMTKEDEQQLEQSASSVLASLARYSERMGEFTAKASEVVGAAGKRIRFCVLLPIGAVFVVSVALGAGSILVIMYIAGA